MKDSSTDDPRERHRALVADGWTRRFTMEEPRLPEMTQMYESMGLEVRIETAIPEAGQECQGCFTVEGFAERYKTIYTRGREDSAPESDDELY